MTTHSSVHESGAPHSGFQRFAVHTAELVGSHGAFVGAVAIIVAWASCCAP
jgi:low affinity Fe/Cu permease